jgi:hypothetical protein
MKKFNICLVGPIGTGKTYSTRTLVDAGLELFIQALEPGVDNQFADIPCPKAHVNYISPAKQDWTEMIRAATDVNTLTMDQLQKMPAANRHKYQQFLDMLRNLADFECQRCKQKFGPVDSWGPERALVVDGLSGMSQMAMDLTVGAKVIRTQPEWGASMNICLRAVRKLCYDTKCTFVLIAHMDREKDDLRGGTVKTVSTLGTKLAPELIKPFDEVICTIRSGAKFHWSTTEMDIDLKDRVLGWSDELEPDFRQFQFGAKE